MSKLLRGVDMTQLNPIPVLCIAIIVYGIVFLFLRSLM